MNIEIREELDYDEFLGNLGSRQPSFLAYGFHTPWWLILYGGQELPYFKGKYNIPCDPRGGSLLQLTVPHEIIGFVEEAGKNPDFYGKHGIRAFMAAYHGVVVVRESGLPTCLDNWDGYNSVIDLLPSCCESCGAINDLS